MTYRIADLDDHILNMWVGSKPVTKAQYGSHIFEYYRYTEISTGTILSGLTGYTRFPDSPIVISSFKQCFYNNNYLIPSNSKYSFQELNNYDFDSSNSDIIIFTAGLYFYTNGVLTDTLYKSVTRYNSATSKIISTTEEVKKDRFIFPSDFGYVKYMEGSKQDLNIGMDQRLWKTQPYEITNLLKTDDLKNDYSFLCSFPTDFEDTLYPSGPNTSKVYTLFSETKTWRESGQDYDTQYSLALKASCEEEDNGKYIFKIYLEDDIDIYLICYKSDFYASSPDQWNKMVRPIKPEVSVLLSSLDTSSLLYQYVKKLVWK